MEKSLVNILVQGQKDYWSLKNLYYGYNNIMDVVWVKLYNKYADKVNQ